jgi:hypothetical protein
VEESTLPLSANAQRIVDDILRLVDVRDQVTFTELDQRVSGFRAWPRFGGHDLTARAARPRPFRVGIPAPRLSTVL